MKKYKWAFITMFFVLSIPLVFWWGVGYGHALDSVLTVHGEELILLQKDIQEMQLHIAELAVENHKLRARISKIQINQETIRIHQRR